MAEKKALIAMSGGVDSSVAAYLTCRAGYRCMGATLRLYDNQELGLPMESTCCSLEDVEDARSVAFRLGMPYYVFNEQQTFRREVMDKFARCYEEGLTPNPCIDCNRYLKFGSLLRRAEILDCQVLVTGHYARIRREGDRYLLYKAVDPGKDQSYVLAMLTQEVLAKLWFPLGELTKEQTRAIAREQGFINAQKRDSQDICFVPVGDYVAFLERYMEKSYLQGDFLDQSGRVLGRHRGAVAYTLGQRKGLGLAMGTPVYVCAKDMAANTVTVGPEAALYRRELVGEDWNWFPFDSLREPLRVEAKTRYRQAQQPATAYPMADGRVRVVFDQPQRAITPGQAVVLYQGDLVVGGGTITQVREEDRVPH